MDIIDLRSDTVTKPTEEMRAAMAAAEVGDDVYGEDPTVNRLQEMAAERMGKEAALFVPSGTMGNLAALLAHCQRGDEAILGDLSHPYMNEAGGLAALGGIQPYTVPNQPDGTIKLEDIEAAIRSDDPHHPITRLVALENSHNRCNGAALSVEYVQSVGKLARENGLILHIDGARIFNAAAALGVSAKEIVGAADSVTFCLSKGLSAPVGSILCGSSDFIRKALRIRKQLGGGMRQAGVLAAAGIVALEKMSVRLGEDHTRAKALAAALAGMPAIKVYPQFTNIVRFKLADGSGTTAEVLVEILAEKGIRIGNGGLWGMRAVTHYWIDDNAVQRAIESFESLLKGA